MLKPDRRPTILCPNSHIQSYSVRPFLTLIFVGCFLSFFGGFINTIAILDFIKIPLSAGTGITSRMTINLATGDFGMMIRLLSLIASFVLGSYISAAIVGGSSFSIKRSYGLVLLLESFALAVAFICQESAADSKGILLVSQISSNLVAIACGLQNCMCTTFSGAVIRTTHVTGILTDIGLILGQATFYPRSRKHLWRLKLLVPLYVAFCCGGVSGWFSHQLLQVKAILLPCIFLAMLGAAHIVYCKIFLPYRTTKKIRKRFQNNGMHDAFVQNKVNKSNSKQYNISISQNDEDFQDNGPNDSRRVSLDQTPSDTQFTPIFLPTPDNTIP